MSFIEKTLAGAYDNDGGGQRPYDRSALRERIRSYAGLVTAIEERGTARKVLTEQDWQVLSELNARCEAQVRPGLRISNQQSNSGTKRGEIAGNRR